MPLKDVKNLGYVVLLCDDLIEMRDFYQTVLNLTINEETEDWIEFWVGSTLLSLRPRGRWYDGTVSGEGASIQLSFQFTPEQVYVAHEALVNKAVEICEPPTDQEFGHRTLYFKDPEKNILEIYAEI